MKKLATLLLALICVPGIALFAQIGYVPSEENLAARERFRDEKFGIFIHWGLYSLLGDGEWNMQVNGIKADEYEKLAHAFYPSGFDASQWVEAIKGSGAKYITLTSRHHEGFSMFKTAQSEYNVVDATPFGRDVVGELAEECHKNGLDLHLYYSLVDWYREDYWPLGQTGHASGRERHGEWSGYLDFMKGQLRELLTSYGEIGCIWFDGIWDKEEFPRGQQPAIWDLYGLYSLIHSIQPACLVGNNHHIDPFEGEDIQLFERDLPGQNEAGLSGKSEISSLPLETCQTMNGSWGYRITDLDYKSSDELIAYLVRTAGMNANFLLNIGPRPDGTLPDLALDRLKDIGKWLSENGESIYGTRGGFITPQPWGVTTQKGNRLYVHILNAEGSELKLSFGTHKVLSVKEFGTVKKIRYRQDRSTGEVTLFLKEAPRSVDHILEVEFR